MSPVVATQLGRVQWHDKKKWLRWNVTFRAYNIMKIKSRPVPISAFPRDLTVSSYPSCSISKRFKSKFPIAGVIRVSKSVKSTITSRVAFRHSAVRHSRNTSRLVLQPEIQKHTEKTLALLQRRPSRRGSPILFAERANSADKSFGDHSLSMPRADRWFL